MISSWYGVGSVQQCVTFVTLCECVYDVCPTYLTILPLFLSFSLFSFPFAQGVRQGIDTFDCVHPTRLGRHGSALVRAAYWQESPNTQLSAAVAASANNRAAKMAAKQSEREYSVKLNRAAAGESTDAVDEEVEPQTLAQSLKAATESAAKKGGVSRTVREHISLMKGPMRHDSRPIVRRTPFQRVRMCVCMYVCICVYVYMWLQVYFWLQNLYSLHTVLIIPL